jgi:phosphopantothenoylcysteine synthetase/decarboxylase
VRYLTVHATGGTAVAMQQRLAERHLACDLLLGAQAVPGAPARRYDSRQDLERELRAWIATNPEGVVVMAAAVNDYEVDQVESIHAGKVMAHGHGGKVPSGADQLVIRLRPAGKVIDNLRAWGLRGPLVAFKYEAAETVVASARSLQRRIGASLVVANSLDGTVQALIDPIRVQACASRDELLAELAVRLVDMAAR